MLVRSATSAGSSRRALLLSHSLGSAASQSPLPVKALALIQRQPTCSTGRVISTCVSARFLTSSSTSGTGRSSGGKKSQEDDPFGVNYNDDSTDGLGPDRPPSFVRDVTTGKLTGEIESELADEERKLLNLTQSDKTRMLADRFVSSWNSSSNEDGLVGDGGGGSRREAEVAERIRTEQMALNVIGRDGADVSSSLGRSSSESGEYVDPAGFTAPLSSSEFQTFRKFVEQEHGIDDLGEDDIPVSRAESGADGTPATGAQHDPDLDLTWLTSAARVEVEGPSADDLGDPFVDLMPSDLNPARKVNRRNAKALPRQLLHHNNLSLLRRFVTPGGQIMNRVRTRLGAKDQRKVAKMIKRARHLGLIPHLGQWKLEDHGNIHEDDIEKEREWEKDLAARGLLERRGGVDEKEGA
mmetsp:Transcript_16442/g.35765  ORF Transcript_16442/g.35765 Transcript_16442/m.35765 type:complete len:411 (+) Transcript_16442:40-1272(+)